MSWDVDLIIRSDGEEATLFEVGNMTYNVSPMYYLALGTEEGLKGLDEMKCRDALPLLQKAVAAMKGDPDTYKAMNPWNGWGRYEIALSFLILLRDECENHPGAIVSIH